jgi:hypothetical protein
MLAEDFAFQNMDAGASYFRNLPRRFRQVTISLNIS